jgi:hypothetical protein
MTKRPFLKLRQGGLALKQGEAIPPLHLIQFIFAEPCDVGELTDTQEQPEVCLFPCGMAFAS